MNSVIIIGNLTRDPELRFSTGANQTAICRFTVAVNDRRRNPQTQEWEDVPSFIPVVVFGKQAENCDRYLAKGRKVAVNGRIQTGSYVNKEGVKVYTTDVIANNVEFLSSRNDGGQGGGWQGSRQNQGGQGGGWQGGQGFGQNDQGFGQNDQGFGQGQNSGGFSSGAGFGDDGGDGGSNDAPPAGFQPLDDDIPF